MQMTGMARKCEVLHHNEDEKLPPQGKYDAGQKVYYWRMLSASVFLILTGPVMWVPETMPRGAALGVAHRDLSPFRRRPVHDRRSDDPHLHVGLQRTW